MASVHLVCNSHFILLRRIKKSSIWLSGIGRKKGARVLTFYYLISKKGTFFWSYFPASYHPYLHFPWEKFFRKSCLYSNSCPTIFSETHWLGLTLIHTINTSFTTTSVQFSLVAQSYMTLCKSMDCNTPGLPVHHQLPEFTQTHVH